MISTCNAPLSDTFVRYSVQYKLFIVLYCTIQYMYCIMFIIVEFSG